MDNLTCSRDRMDYCEKLFVGRLDVFQERLRGMDIALKLYAGEMERRLQLLNELREEFTRKEAKFALDDDLKSSESRLLKLYSKTGSDEVVKGIEVRLLKLSSDYVPRDVHRDLEKRVAKMETRSIVWIGVITFLFMLFQLALKIWK